LARLLDEGDAHALHFRMHDRVELLQLCRLTEYDAAQRRTVDELTEEDFDFALAVNLKSMFLVSQALIPAMKAAKWGRIISISSTAAHTGGVVGPHYAASKAGMIGLTHAYARDLARHGITANVILHFMMIAQINKGVSLGNAIIYYAQYYHISGNMVTGCIGKIYRFWLFEHGFGLVHNIAHIVAA